MTYCVRIRATGYKIIEGESKAECLPYWWAGKTELCWYPNDWREPKRMPEDQKRRMLRTRRINNIKKKYPLFADELIAREVTG